ncbi:hypothetical protein IV203_033789 [Nitzschia inconspicua]|uniref:DUF7869 domain-containing protein n=1 Tax=Nitzschia inconspicua TaxID=303405 RepID=A0A9K3M4D7_9STRA|nr:hypothetical protein IV203_033789 [Nitzschia inconspicua]
MRHDGDGAAIWGKELNVVMDNCAGQNKNNHVLLLAPYLVEMGYFRTVNMLFLVAGHTKNVCDRLFNNLKREYHNAQVFTFDQAVEILGRSQHVHVWKIDPQNDWKKYGDFLRQLYVTLAEEKLSIANNHIFCAEWSEEHVTVNTGKLCHHQLTSSSPYSHNNITTNNNNNNVINNHHNDSNRDTNIDQYNGSGEYPPGTADITVHPPASPSTNHDLAGIGNDPAVATDTSNSKIAPGSNSLAADVVAETSAVVVEYPYTAEQLAAIATEATFMFCVGVTFNSSEELREAVRKFDHIKGFSITSIANRFSCSRCAEAHATLPPTNCTREEKEEEHHKSWL